MYSADGFSEWQKLGNRKQPNYIRKISGERFAFGGLGDRWKSPEGTEVESFSIVTVEPNELASKIHNRMPLMLDTDQVNTWLNPKATPEQLTPLLVPYAADQMECLPVSTVVNSPKNIGAECVISIAPISGEMN